MTTIRLGANDLLEYNSQYSVLICRECQYAIQKSAIQSHLLRHKIYRGDRQRLLDSIKNLDLFEPDDVPLPDRTSAPIESLPVISGFSCTSPECGNLCASSKRMKRHWSEAHGIAENGSLTDAQARPVSLQTFFKGTKIRYFEINPGTDYRKNDSDEISNVYPQVSSAITGNDEVDYTQARPEFTCNDEIDSSGATTRMELDPVSQVQAHIDNSIKSSATYDSPLVPWIGMSRSTTDASSEAPADSPLTLDLTTIRYFHHFTTSTHSTLPNGDTSGQISSNYWQTHAVRHALGQRWLMFGILAIAASHATTLASDPNEKQIHLRQWKTYESQFFSELHKVIGLVWKAQDESSIRLGYQIRSILRCAQVVVPEYITYSTANSESTPGCDIHSIISAIKDFTTFPTAPQSSHPKSTSNPSSQHDMLVQASRLLITQDLSGTSLPLPHCSHPATNLSVRISTLRSLPSRIAAAVGKPSFKVHNVYACLSAISTLIDCCEVSFASETVEAAWQGMATWISRIPQEMEVMMARASPVAFLVLAHWAVYLLKRVEGMGAWYLEGATRRVVRRLWELLPEWNEPMKELMVELMETGLGVGRDGEQVERRSTCMEPGMARGQSPPNTSSMHQ